MKTKFPVALLIALTSAAISASAAVTAAVTAVMIHPGVPMTTRTWNTGPSIPVVDSAAIEKSLDELKQRLAMMERERADLEKLKSK
ncbi:hypothetical protein [Burkholderia sp. Tr-20390]|uniref:hypothetical protein n=1 Tax=Burkholderia sp. Tr-20390 TaxID=2703904 RepID=UPI0019824F31|nr:hypothetical protein [Burkholderia sp. Tr-20390]MBN3733151.1 hypothetical protein [Burkholderia sp. Tr-20390]